MTELEDSLARAVMQLLLASDVPNDPDDIEYFREKLAAALQRKPMPAPAVGRFELMKRVLGAMDVVVEDDGQALLHVPSGRRLKAKWCEEVAEDLVHFHGLDASTELGLVIISEVWSAVCQIHDEILACEEVFSDG